VDSSPTASSPQFVSEDQRYTVQDSVTIYSSVKAARASFDSLADPKTPQCLTTVLNGTGKAVLARGFGSGASIGSINVNRAPSDDFAPGSANFTATLPVTKHGVTLTLELIVVDFVKGNEEQTVTFNSVEGPFPLPLAGHLTALALARI